jgi:hypothetical protein
MSMRRKATRGEPNHIRESASATSIGVNGKHRSVSIQAMSGEIAINVKMSCTLYCAK